MKELPAPVINELLDQPDQVEGWEKLAMLLAEREMWKQAADALETAAEMDPFHLWRWFAIIEWREQCGQISRAIKTILTAIEQYAQNPKGESTFEIDGTIISAEEILLREELAKLYSKGARWVECERTCMQLLEFDPYNISVMELMAEACTQIHHLEAAEQLLQTLLRIVPLDPFYRLDYARVLRMQDKLNAAQRQFLQLQAMSIPSSIKEEVDENIRMLDQAQVARIGTMLQNHPKLAQSIAYSPRQQLEERGFHLTDRAVETVQNLLWEHFQLSPYLALDTKDSKPRLQ